MIFQKRVALSGKVAEAVYHHSPDAMLLLRGGVFVECNPSAATLYDRPIKEIIGNNPIALSTPTQDGRPTAECVNERVKIALRDGFSRFDWYVVDRSNVPVRVLCTLIPANVGMADDLIVILQSLAETEVAMDALRGGLGQLADGNLTHRLDVPFRPDYEPLRDSFNQSIEQLHDSVLHVAESARRIAIGATEIRGASDDLSKRTEQQAAALEETAATMSEVTGAVRETAAGAARVDTMVSETRKVAEQSGEIVTRAVAAMDGIERTSGEISEIISVIDGIAFQTNLLALNAGVEAARAGDAGKGFAVVASEVRALAQRSADAAKDVKARVTASAEQVEVGVKLVSATGTALSGIIGRVNEISKIVSGIAGSAERQATGLQEVSTAVAEMDGVTQQNAAMVEEATAATRSLASEAEELASEVARFRLTAATSGIKEHSVVRPVHQLQVRAEQGARRIAQAARRPGPVTAAVAADESWSSF